MQNLSTPYRIVSRVALGGAFSSLTWSQIRNLRARYWAASNDPKRRLGYLRRFLRRRAYFRLTVVPTLASVAGALAALVPDRAWATCGQVALAVSLPLAAYGFAVGRRWIERQIPRSGESDGVESWGGPNACREFEMAVSRVRARHGDAFRLLADDGEFAWPRTSRRATRHRVRPTGDPRELFSSGPIAWRRRVSQSANAAA